MARTKATKFLPLNASALSVQRGILVVLLIGLGICGLVLIYQGDNSKSIVPDAGTAIEDIQEDVGQSDPDTNQREEE